MELFAFRRDPGREGDKRFPTINGEENDDNEMFNITPEQRAELCAMMGKRFNELETAPEVDYMIQLIYQISEEDAVTIIEQSLEDHESDPNFHRSTREYLSKLIRGENVGISDSNLPFFLRIEAALIHFHSPYPEVRAVTDPLDNPLRSCETFRVYFLGIIWVIIGCGVNQFFEPRMPPVTIPLPLLQILVFPCGKILEWLLPIREFVILGKVIRLNPGPWTEKEQALVTIMFGITSSMAYVSDQIFVQRLKRFYNNDWADAGYQITLLLSTQFLGFGLAGLARHILLLPSQCIWPTILPVIALNRALVVKDGDQLINGWTMSRRKFFIIAFCGMFFYFWLPGYIFQALAYFNWITWISPGNFNLANITGSISGLGVNPWPTWDWNIATAMISPLSTPFFAVANNYLGTIIAGCIVIPIVFYKNLYYTGYLPINSSNVFTNTGEQYIVENVLTNNILDHDKYQNYSPPFYSAANLVVYGAFFALYPALIVQSWLYYRKVIKSGAIAIWKTVTMKNFEINSTEVDAHYRMMLQYPEVPIIWYLTVSAIALILGIICVKVYPTEAPVWSIFYGLGIGLVFLIPIGLLYSTTGFSLSLNVLTELIAGYALPGKGVALMIMKSFGLNTNLQAIYFIQDQKIGHYSKVSPRATFRCQIIATLVQSFVVLGVANWQINNYKNICVDEPGQNFICPNESVYYSASIIWGVIGPRRIFSGSYPILKWCFLIGMFLPFPIYFAQKLGGQRFPVLLRLDTLLIILGFLNFAPYNLTYFTTSFYVSFIFMYYIRHKYMLWFQKYNYILSTGFSAGIALSSIIIFFALQYKDRRLEWWGNTISEKGMDGNTTHRYLPLPEQGYFGPDPGNYTY